MNNIQTDNMSDRLNYLSDIFDYIFNIATNINSIKRWNFGHVTRQLSYVQTNYLMLSEKISTESYNMMIRESQSIDKYKFNWDDSDLNNASILKLSYDDINELMYDYSDIDKIRNRINNDGLCLSLKILKESIIDQLYSILDAYITKMNKLKVREKYYG